MQCIQEVEVWFYHHWLLKYPMKCAPARQAGSHLTGYLDMQFVSMPEVHTGPLKSDP